MPPTTIANTSVISFGEQERGAEIEAVRAALTEGEEAASQSALKQTPSGESFAAYMAEYRHSRRPNQ
jgi:hypothetical protein